MSQEWAPTGIPAVDDAVEMLRSLDDLEVHEHPAVFDAVHASLREVLADAGKPTTP